MAGTVGAAITLLNVRNSFRDRSFVDELWDDPAIHRRHWEMIRLAARGREESQFTRLLICLLICTSGIVGVLQSNPLRGATTWTAFVVTAALIAIATLTAHRSYRDLMLRRRMLELAQGRTSVIAARLRAQHLDDAEEVKP